LITQAPIQDHDLQNVDRITQQVVKLLNDMGIVFPTRISPDEIVQFPLDITQSSLLEVGELHSYWTAMHARDSGVHGMVVAQKRSLKFQISKLKALVASSKDEKVKAQFQQTMGELEQQFARIDAMDAILDSVVDGHKRYSDAASRELSRRQIEAQLTR
jgi:hypothetical protein